MELTTTRYHFSYDTNIYFLTKRKMEEGDIIGSVLIPRNSVCTYVGYALCKSSHAIPLAYHSNGQRLYRMDHYFCATWTYYISSVSLSFYLISLETHITDSHVFI